MEEQLVPA